MARRFAVPKGLLGYLYSNPLDLPRPQEKQPSDIDNGMQWVLLDQNLFSTSTQLYLCRTVRTGSLPSEASDGPLAASQLLECQHMSEPCQLCRLGTLNCVGLVKELYSVLRCMRICPLDRLLAPPTSLHLLCNSALRLTLHLSADAPGQKWEFKFQSFIQSNIRLLPEHRLQRGTYDGQRQQGQLTIPFRMEADVFGNSGIAQVAHHDLHCADSAISNTLHLAILAAARMTVHAKRITMSEKLCCHVLVSSRGCGCKHISREFI